MSSPVHHVSFVPHHRRFPDVSALAILLEHGRVQIQSRVVGLIVQCDHLNPEGPEYDRVEICGVDAHSCGVRSNELGLRMGDYS